MPDLYPFQQEAINGLCHGKRFCIMPVGTGKAAVMFNWLKWTNKRKVLIVTTASKVRTGDFLEEAKKMVRARVAR